MPLKSKLIFFIAIAVLFSFAAFLRNNVYVSEMALWEDARDKSLAKARPHANFGIVLEMAGLHDEAAFELEAAIWINPFFAAAHNSLGNSLYERGMIEKAISEYKRALDIDPDSAEAHNNLGLAYEMTGRMNEALFEYKEAIRIKPYFPAAHRNLGIIYLEYFRDRRTAAVHFAKALELDPDLPDKERIRKYSKE